jgi:hypothetical protein
MSARSIDRPRTRNCQPSSRVIVASAVPLTSAARSRTQPKTVGGRRVRKRPDGMARQVVLIASHSGSDSVSRARRADSRAAARVAAIEAGELTSYASRSSTAREVTGLSESASTPMIESSVRQVVSSSTVESSSISWSWTSRMRAVSSARST